MAQATAKKPPQEVIPSGMVPVLDYFGYSKEAGYQKIMHSLGNLAPDASRAFKYLRNSGMLKSKDDSGALKEFRELAKDQSKTLAIQQALITGGFKDRYGHVLAPDDQFGPLTRSALKNFYASASKVAGVLQLVPVPTSQAVAENAMKSGLPKQAQKPISSLYDVDLYNPLGSRQMPQPYLGQCLGRRRPGFRPHMGLDISATGAVFAPFQGKVIFAAKSRTNPDRDGYIVLMGTETPDGTELLVRYVHLESINVKAGQALQPGAKVGRILPSQGHLHYELYAVIPKTLSYEKWTAGNPKIDLDYASMIRSRNPGISEKNLEVLLKDMSRFLSGEVLRQSGLLAPKDKVFLPIDASKILF